ncbi:MAG: M28 family peptidase [Phycisphaerales bacterium]
MTATAPAPAAAHAEGGAAVAERMLVPARTSEELESDARTYKQHIFTLADPYMEGRAPGTEGNRRAAQYVEWNYRKLGLLPAFPQSVAGDDAPLEPLSAGQTVQYSYRQRFVAPPSMRPGDSVRVASQECKIYNGRGEERRNLIPGTDFSTLGYSPSGSAGGAMDGNVVFCGYAIDEGEGGYTSFPRDNDGKKIRLEGKIAFILRFEPMNDEGKSKWSSSRWSGNADLTSKIDTVIDLGASAVILVNPPGADDNRAKTLGDLSMGLSTRARKVPVIMLSNEMADAFVRDADVDGRDLMTLRKVADELEKEQAYIELSRASISINVDVQRTPLMTDNVGAILPGAGELKDQYIVIGSHYDHVGYGYFGSGNGEKGKGILHPGADDNASGTSGNLLIAKRLAEAYAKMDENTPRRSIIFMAFSAEESGLKGSEHYVNHPIVDLSKHALMLNMDMIGRLKDEKLEFSGVGTAEGLKDFVQPYLDSSGMTVASKPSGLGPSDHASFAQSNVPALFAFTGLHEDYHKITDTPDLINYEGASKVVDMVYRIALDAAQYKPGFPFISATGRISTKKDGAADPHAADPNDPNNTGQSMRGVGVRFGIAPGDYGGNEEGILIGDVMDGLPAQKAGLLKGDLMKKWNDTTLIDVEQWMGLLSKHKPGDKVKIVYLRDGKEMTTEVELVARQRSRD